MTALTAMTPAQIDAQWAEAVEPVNRLFEQAHAKRVNADRYRKFGGRYAEQADRYDEEADALYARARELRAEVEPPFQAEWERRGGWTRAYVVPAGHIHRTTACHTLYPTTIIRWLPDQSGWDEEKIVEAAGAMACTVCYPTAPVEELRAAAAAEKAKDECPGSRQYAKTLKGWGRYTACHVCGQSVSVTTAHNLRAHKRKAVA